MTHKQIIVNNMKHIFCHLVLNYSTKGTDKILENIGKDTQLKKNNLLMAGFDIDIELIMHLGQKHKEVRKKSNASIYLNYAMIEVQLPTFNAPFW